MSLSNAISLLMLRIADEKRLPFSIRVPYLTVASEKVRKNRCTTRVQARPLSLPVR